MIFVETPPFERLREKYLDDNQFRLLQATLMARPDAGAIIVGSGGIRKIRWSVEGRGKRGGLRVIYFWLSAEGHVYFLTVYRKSEVADLSRDEIRALREIVRQIERQR
jgi:hypothetical protein